MQARIFALIIYIYAFSIPNSRAGELVISGVYMGKNVYIQNPSCGNGSQFSTRMVYVNGTLTVNNPTTSAYEIDLSGLQIYEAVEIKIIYSENCAPEVINPQVIRPKSSFYFQKVSVGEDSISWVTQGESNIHKFLIEKREDSNWLIFKTCDGLGNQFNHYSIAVPHDIGENQYRIKYISGEGKIFYSGVISYYYDKEPVTFFPQRVSGKITLSRIANFEVLDPQGNVMVKGKDKEIICKDLTPGLYYLVLENRTEKFIKK